MCGMLCALACDTWNMSRTHTHHYCVVHHLTWARSGIRSPCMCCVVMSMYLVLWAIIPIWVCIQYYEFTTYCLFLGRGTPQHLLWHTRPFKDYSSSPTFCPAYFCHGGTHPTHSALHCNQQLAWSITARCVACVTLWDGVCCIRSHPCTAYNHSLLLCLHHHCLSSALYSFHIYSTF